MTTDELKDIAQEVAHARTRHDAAVDEYERASTERKEAMEALDTAEAKLNDAVDQLVDGLTNAKAAA